MSPIYSTTILADARFTSVGPIREYLDRLIDEAPALLPYLLALTELLDPKRETRIEIFEEPATGDSRVLVLCLPDTPRAAVKAYHRGERA